MMRTGSRKLAWAITMLATALTAYSIHKGLEGLGVAIWSVGIPAATGLYVNKQYQERKTKEIEQQSINEQLLN